MENMKSGNTIVGNVKNNQGCSFYFCFINRYKRKVCLMSYLIKPDEDSKVSSAQKSFGRYKLIESRETGENGALLEHPSINAEGFEFRRISHEYSFRLS